MQIPYTHTHTHTRHGTGKMGWGNMFVQWYFQGTLSADAGMAALHADILASFRGHEIQEQQLLH